jgi:hypothetical protein
LHTTRLAGQVALIASFILGIVLTLLALTLAVAFIGLFVIVVGRLGTLIETLLKKSITSA